MQPEVLWMSYIAYGLLIDAPHAVSSRTGQYNSYAPYVPSEPH